MLGEPAEEEHWQKVGLKPLCLCLQLGQLVRFASLLLNSNKSSVNASSSSVRDHYQTRHSSRHGKTQNISAKDASQSKGMNDQVTSLPLSALLQIIQYTSAKFHLVPVVTNFIHSGIYMLPNQKITFILTLSHDCCVQGNAEQDPSFH